ncbi:hypothetical protein [Achromobacter phage Motura]|uniref:Uncharacterized protein n=1 Tax=Achromobacter phage Motura TaxID=2591403 RepID=A0A514CT95_9CAUD|nr:hypothetical protein H1O15_gp277 [Achromobacter phage Motura]QDH83684.1 hypothetical protein [Achromobacter phage Motura]
MKTWIIGAVLIAAVVALGFFAGNNSVPSGSKSQPSQSQSNKYKF